jgi:hypothetical protein
MPITRCTFVGHKWENRRYPDAPPEDRGATYGECRRCGKRRDVEVGPGILRYTAGGQF